MNSKSKFSKSHLKADLEKQVQKVHKIDDYIYDPIHDFLSDNYSGIFNHLSEDKYDRYVDQFHKVVAKYKY
jgi:hypothetical protein